MNDVQYIFKTSFENIVFNVWRGETEFSHVAGTAHHVSLLK